MAKKVLIADDEPNIVTALEFLLERNGYEVHIARDGEGALRMRERVEWRNIKIIILTAKGRDVEVSKGLSIGADLYITKPFSTQELMARINGLLGVGAA
jgi:two-component system, OmpR family, alkaline phosphatase synthesis response regulator PhoP